MPLNLNSQARADGYANGLLKASGLGSLLLGPVGRKSMTALGEDVFRGATNPASPFKALLYRLLTNNPQISNASAIARSKKPDAKALSQIFAEIGEVAAPRINTGRGVLAAGAGASVAGVGGLAAGNMAGEANQAKRDRSALQNSSVFDRLKYTLLPNRAPLPQPTPFYERFRM